MKYQPDQKVFIIDKSQVIEASIRWRDRIKGLYYFEPTDGLAFLIRGAECVFETKEKAQEYLDNIDNLAQ